jgi:hypothetical protein
MFISGLQVYAAALIALIGRLINDVPEIVQVPDTPVVSGTRRDLGQRHDLMRIGLHLFRTAIRLPVLQQSSEQANMGTTDPGVIADRLEKYR